MIHALDTGILACAVNRHVPEHARAARIVEEFANGERPWALPWSVVHEFLSLVTHPHAVVRALRPEDAWTFIEGLTGSPTLRMLGPTPRHAAAIAEVIGMLPADTAGVVAGFDTAVLLREHGVRELLSADRGMRRFPFLEIRDPLHGETWSPDDPPARRYRMLSPRPAKP